MFTHNITVQWSRGNDQFSKTITKEAGGEINLQEAVADGQTALLMNLAIDVSALKSLVIVADQNLTLKTNSSGSPDDTIALKANEPLLWWLNSPYANPLSVDVTKIYLANASGEDATLNIRGLQDVTP